MKKLFLLIGFIYVAFHTQGQTTKGSISITGTLGYNQGKEINDQEHNGVKLKYEGYNYTLSPSLGYFIKDNLELGVLFSYYKHNNESRLPSNNSVYVSTYEGKNESLRIYAKQYKYLADKVAFHATLSAGKSRKVELSTSSYPDPDGYNWNNRRHDRTDAFSIGLSPGFTLFPSSKVGLTLNLGALMFSRQKIKYTNLTSYNDSPQQIPNLTDRSTKSNLLELNFSSMNLNFGLSYYLSR